MRPAARISDPHTCPKITGTTPHVGGPVSEGCATVIVEGKLQARVGDKLDCNGPPDTILTGSPSVIVGGAAAAREGDPTVHGGVVVSGCSTVLIGDPSDFNCGLKTWVSIALKRADGTPLAGEHYEIKLPDGSTRSGTLDSSGRAFFDDIEPGECDVRFPNLDDDWGLE